jgi:hypothetical protein
LLRLLTRVLVEVIGKPRPKINPGEGGFVGDQKSEEIRSSKGSPNRDDPAVTVAENDDGPEGLDRSGDGAQVVDVTVEIDGLATTTPLVPATVVGHDVEMLASACDTGKGATSVEAPVNANEGGTGSLDLPLPRGEPRDEWSRGRYEAPRGNRRS